MRPLPTSAHATAQSNIALIKYWGKRDADLAIPSTSSLSMTLDVFPTQTSVSFDPTLDDDSITLDGTRMSPAAERRTRVFLDLVRERAGVDHRASVTSFNEVPTGAGLASSASGFAALAAAASSAAGLDLSPRELSRLARRGSGSAARSVFGGMVQWNAGHDDESSYAEPVEFARLDIAMVVVVVNAAEKHLSSREGMQRTVETSPFYDPWVARSAVDLRQMRDAIADGDLARVCDIAESNSLGMHGTMLGARPPFTYWEPSTLGAINAVHRLRADGITCGFTMDAGPNVKIVCSPDDAPRVQSEIASALPEATVITARPGPGVTVQTSDDSPALDDPNPEGTAAGSGPLASDRPTAESVMARDA